MKKDKQMNKKEFTKDFLNHMYYDKNQNKVFRKHDNEEYNNIFREIHGTDFSPDDFRYETIYNILNQLLNDYEIDFNEDLRENAQDFMHEIIDSLIPIYNHERMEWLSSNGLRSYYVNEAQENGLIASDADIYDRIAAGMYSEIEEIFYNVINAIENNFED